jgi:hypothetical protein
LQFRNADSSTIHSAEGIYWQSAITLTWIIHKIVAKNTYLSENIKDTIEKSYKE